MSVIAPGVTEELVLLQTLKFTLFADGYAMIVSIPATKGTYPVTAVGSPLNPHKMTSVVAVFVAEVVTAVAHAAEPIAPVPIADVPLATVVLRPPAADRLTPRAVRTFEPRAAHAIVVLAEFSIRHGAVEPTIVVVPGVIEEALAVTAAQLVTPDPFEVRTKLFVPFFVEK